ncbi:MAG: hypothetical protein ACUVWP_00600 [bacterium]
MKKYLVVILGLLMVGSVMAYVAFPTEIPNKSLLPESNAEKDMRYHGTPKYYFTFNSSNITLACWFKPGDFSVNTNFRIKTIGLMVYRTGGSANIYVYLSETHNHPNDTPPIFNNKKYGPKYYVFVDTLGDCDVYAENWYITKSEIDNQPNHRFWVLWHLISSPTPLSDEATNPKNSMIFIPGTGWTTNISGYYPCWCSHVLVEYPPTMIESTSVGTVKALFK